MLSAKPKKLLIKTFPGILKYKNTVKALYEKAVWPLRYMPGSSTVWGPPRGLNADTVSYNNRNPATPIIEWVVKEASYRIKTLPLFNSNFVEEYFSSRVRTEFIEKKAWVFKNARYVYRDCTIITSDDKIFLPASPIRPWRVNKDHQSFYHIKLPKMVRLQKVILMHTLKADKNYCHWIRDHLSRFFWLRQLNIDFSEYTLVSSHGNQDYCKHTKQLLIDDGFDFKEWLFIKDFDHFYADEIILPPITNFNLRNGVLNNEEVHFLRELIKPVKLNDEVCDKIYLSRRKSRRSSAQESELVERLAPYGVKEVFLEDMSIFEQCALFKKATLIIGLHGAAFINLAFCEKGITAIEIFGANYVVSAYWNLADVLDLNYYPYCDNDYKEAVTDTMAHLAPTHLDIDKFFAFLNNLNLL